MFFFNHNSSYWPLSGPPHTAAPLRSRGTVSLPLLSLAAQNLIQASRFRIPKGLLSRKNFSFVPLMPSPDVKNWKPAAAAHLFPSSLPHPFLSFPANLKANTVNSICIFLPQSDCSIKKGQVHARRQLRLICMSSYPLQGPCTWCLLNSVPSVLLTGTVIHSWTWQLWEREVSQKWSSPC